METIKIGDMNIVIKKPQKVFSYSKRKTRSKQPRTVYVKKFERCIEWLKDGQIIEDKINKVHYMNQKTVNSMMEKLEEHYGDIKW